ncbi:MAG: ABC transporter permease [Trueperaceae bacterium]|nr:MAG: ABC transporter permease [Trueperaceae bacterium]
MLLRFSIERVFHMIVVMWLVATLVFFIFRILPGDPAQLVLGLEPSRASLEALREQMGLNRPLAVQYGEWLWRAAQGDLGTSISQGNRTVASLIFPAMWRTLELAVIAMLLGLLISVPLGTLAARRAGTWIDQLARLFALAGFSLPSYWLAILLMLAFSYHWNVLPAGGYVGPAENPVQHLRHLVLPTITVGLVMSAVLTRFMRSGMLEVLSLDYIRTAHAKGLLPTIVVYRHALRNAMLPFITVLGINFGSLIGGMVVTEQVFAWPGLGWLIIQSIIVRSYPVVQGAVLITAAIFVTVNLIVDLFYAVIDPRISYA